MILNSTVLILFILLIINIFFYIYNFKIGKLLGILDIPDGKRKLHKNIIPLTGGVFLFLNIIFYFFFLIYNINFNSFEKLLIFNNTIELIIFFLSCLFIFILGFVDDKLHISANVKLLCLIIIFVSLILSDKLIIINEIRISFLSFNFDIGYFSYFWTLICFLLFINAINMFDGFNLQSGTYSFLFLIFLFLKGLDINLFITLSIFFLFFLFQNYKNKCFFGDSGTYLISFILSYFCIKLYNNQNIIFADEIVIAMLIPGLDLMRLFFFRIINKRHPFSADREHLHHYLLNNLGEMKTLIIIITIIYLPLIFSQIYNIYLEMIILQIFFYLMIILKYKNKIH